MRRLMVTALLLIAVRLHAIEFERVLLPITVLDVPGAYGSLWRSEAWADIRESGVTILLVRQTHANPQPPGSQQLSIFFNGPGQEPGQFLQVTRGAQISFNLRIRDLSRAAETWGTEIPVVWERDFRTTVTLLPIPANDEFRSTVRIYGGTAGDVRVRVTDLETSAVLSDDVISLPATISEYQPPYAELNLPTNANLMRVDVDAVSPDLRFWAFASVTNNATQHVTTISPQ
ncbi:MAG: hypothetical protein JO197_17165 [Acidobacteria bacterium]|nr:hypothetical protein [Acidobacteriota bacterium]MBV9478446.1 hypothetical protein [Acidobacteriota bacterium]